MLTVTSPPLKEVRELAQRSMCKGGDVYNQLIDKSTNRQIASSSNSPSILQ